MKTFIITYSTPTSSYNRTTTTAVDRTTAVRNMTARGYKVTSAVCCD